MPAVDLIFPLFFYRSDPYKFNKEQLDYIKTYKDKSRINVGNNYISKSSHVLEDNKLKYIKSFIQKELVLIQKIVTTICIIIQIV